MHFFKITPILTQLGTFLFLLLFQLTTSAQITVDRFMGVNTLREDPIKRMKAVGFIREYHSWYLNEGNPSLTLTDFSPSYPNAKYRWDQVYQDLTYTRFGKFYKAIRQTNDIEIAPAFQGNLFQIVDPTRVTYQADNHIVQEQKPIAPGANSLDPASYKAHAAYLYHYAARYGHNTFSLNDFNNLIVPRTHPEETPKTGLGLVEYMESWNEQDKWWWRGSHPDTYFSPQEYATMLSADYDGHGQTLGAGIGIKNADPNMKVVMGGLAEANLDYIRGMVDWSITNRSQLQPSHGVLPFQVLNIHHYIGNHPNFLQSTQGVSPEHANLRGFLKTFDDYRDSLNLAMGTDLELWLSEFGYDTYAPGSTGSPVVIAPQIGDNDSYEVQGQWITRIYLEALAAEIDRAMLFFLRDEQTPYTGLYSSSGLLENAANYHKPKNSWFYTYTMKNVLTNMVFDDDVSPCSDTTCVRIYRFKSIEQGSTKKIFAIWSPTASAKEFPYQFTLEDVEDETLVELELPSIWGKTSVITEEFPTINVSEKPVFIIMNDDYPIAPPLAAAPQVNNATCGSLNLQMNAPANSGTYQLWYMEGNFTAVDFSHRLAKLVGEDFTPADTDITVANLKPNTPYTFFLFPEGIPKSDVANIGVARGVTTDTTCKIPIDPNWIFDDYKNHINPDGLFDNQQEFDPMCDPTTGFPSNNDLWGFNYDLNDSMQVSIDLQAYYHIDAFTIHDEASRGYFTIQTAVSPNGPWTTVVDYLTIGFNEWKTLTNVLSPDQPVRYLRFVAEKNDAAKVGEIFLCGRPSTYNPDILPGVAVNGLVKNITCEAMTLEWNHPFDTDIQSYKIVNNGLVIANVPYNAGIQTFLADDLSEDIFYEFSIITIDQAGQESLDSLLLSGTTLGGINQCKIPLNPSMIFDFHKTLNNAQKLVDQQADFDPICTPSSLPTDLWGADFTDSDGQEYVSLDLQAYYQIDDLYLHDGGGLAGNIKVQKANSPNGPWATIIDYDTEKFNDWIHFNNPLATNQLVRYLRIEASTDDAVATGEIFLCGTVDATYNPDILPGVGKNARVTNLSCDSVTIEWEAPLDNDIKEYKVFGGPIPQTTTTPSITIKNLSDNTTYNFEIITVDNAGQESTQVLQVTVKTHITGECSIQCNYSCPCAICLRPSWLTQNTTKFVLAHLVDEQNTVPMPDRNETGGNPNTLWSYDYSGTTFPVEVEIDLQAKYALTNGQLFFQGGSNLNLTLDYLDENGHWVEFISYPTGSHFGWKSYDLTGIETQFIKIINPDPNAGIREIGFCGTPVEEICPSSLNLSAPITQNETFQAETITSSAEIIVAMNVDYLAQNSITLMPGFHAVANTNFLAAIANCPNNSTTESMANFSQLPITNPTELPQNELQVFPNPFQTNTNLVYSLAEASKVKLAIFNTTGQKVKTLINDQLIEAGTHQILFTPVLRQSGFYIAHLQIGSQVLVKKMMLTGF